MRRRMVNDVMTRAVVSAYRGASFKDIVQVMIKRGITAMPVIDEGHRVALVPDLVTDLLIGTGEDAQQVAAADDPDQTVLIVDHRHDTMRQSDLIPIVVRLAAATDGVVGVIDELNRDMAGAEP